MASLSANNSSPSLSTFFSTPFTVKVAGTRISVAVPLYFVTVTPSPQTSVSHKDCWALLCVSADTAKTPAGSIRAIITIAKSPDKARLKNDFFIMKTPSLIFHFPFSIHTVFVAFKNAGHNCEKLQQNINYVVNEIFLQISLYHQTMLLSTKILHFHVYPVIHNKIGK